MHSTLQNSHYSTLHEVLEVCRPGLTPAEEQEEEENWTTQCQDLAFERKSTFITVIEEKGRECRREKKALIVSINFSFLIVRE